MMNANMLRSAAPGALLVAALIVAVSLPAAAYVVVGYPTGPVTVRVAPQPTVYVAPVTPSVVYALPGGCAPVQWGGVVFTNCSGNYYRPYYYGPNVVYAPVPPPY